MKRFITVFILLALTVSIFAGGEGEASDQKIVGIAMPTQSSQRWIQDGNYMKEILEERGYYG